MNLQSREEPSSGLWSASQRQWRLVGLALLAVGGIALLSCRLRAPSVFGAREGIEREGWVDEVVSVAANVECPHERDKLRRRLVEETMANLPVYREQARVDSAQYLKSLLQVERALQCVHPSLSEEDAVVQQLTAARIALQTDVARLVRAYQMSLRRSQIREDTPKALSLVLALRELLHAHEGELSGRLRGLQRELEGKVIHYRLLQ